MSVARSSVRGGVPTAGRLVWELRRDGRERAPRLSRRPDSLAVEEPLEIRVTAPTSPSLPAEKMTVTMRTPGSDFELAVGWLFAEGVVEGPDDIAAVRYCTDEDLDEEQRYNVVTVDLTRAAAARVERAGGLSARLTFTSSSCGVCGTASIEALSARVGHVASETGFALDEVLSWPSLLREKGQTGFAATGGLHAAALVTAEGELLVAREDIGRHNAVDKVAGWALLEAGAGRLTLPLAGAGLVVSGRTSFEIVQKALCLGLPVLAAVSAASSLAARLADERGLTLVGFVRDGRCTVYSHPERLRPAQNP